MKFSIKNFFSTDLLKKSLMKNFIFSAVTLFWKRMFLTVLCESLTKICWNNTAKKAHKSLFYNVVGSDRYSSQSSENFLNV